MLTDQTRPLERWDFSTDEEWSSYLAKLIDGNALLMLLAGDNSEPFEENSTFSDMFGGQPEDDQWSDLASLGSLRDWPAEDPTPHVNWVREGF